MLDETFESSHLSPGSPASGSAKEARIVRACWMAFWINTIVAVFEIGSGLLGYSALLIIDGLTSAAIAVVVTTSILGIYMSDESAVRKPYHYGQGKAQYLAALVTGIVLGVAGVTYWGISIKRIGYTTFSDGLGIGAAVASIAIMASVFVLVFMRHVRVTFRLSQFRSLERLQQFSLLASIMVLQSYFALAYQWIVGDRIARFSISFLVTTMSFFIIKEALNGLMDRSGGEEIEKEIESLVRSVEQVRDVRWVRSRRVGSKIYTEMKVEMDKDGKVSDFDRVTMRIKSTLSEKLEEPVRIVNVEYCVVE
jgi:cation diffusion facilitator family transporter